MRYFEKFPQGKMCPICGTNAAGECFLMPIDGTRNDGIEEAAPTHRACAGDVLAPLLRYNRDHSVIYARGV